MASSSIPVLYSTPHAGAVADFVSTHYGLPGPLACKLLIRGWNDTFEVRAGSSERFVLRISKARARGDADVASETAFLAYLDGQGIPVAAAVPTRDGALFASIDLPEGQRPVVLFCYAEGRPSRGGSSTADAWANGVTLARIHGAASGFAAADKGRYRLDGNHLLDRPLSSILAVEDLGDSVRTGLVALSGRLSAALAERDGLSWTCCHGDCHGYNANIAQHGPRAGQAVFFDFDESGPGYLAYDIAVFLHCCIAFERRQHAFWHAFIEGYRSIRDVPDADFEAVRLFVPIRHLWFVGEYASRIHEWGKQAVPADWIAAQLEFMLSWEREQLAPALL